ncbi:interleukin-31 [Saccopteryx bilineata]|uniref:interleukin-31 n=1 Tax=Saccopteryx bilineata TaxID=59482 RepID=UPI00338E05E6
MVSHAGPSGLALFLLYCMGPLLSVHMAPVGNDLQVMIIELWDSSKKLLENYRNNENGLPPSTSNTLPALAFASDCQRPHGFNGSAALPYFQAIRPLLEDKSVIDKIIDQLSKTKLPRGPEVEVSLPTASFEEKRFTLAVLHKFYDCMKSLYQAVRASVKQG